MKILRLDLRAYGPFTDAALDLSAGAEGLHIVYGPNEAGKSSTLRAIRALLYGIPVQTPDNFRHDYDRLAVGGTLRSADGQELPFLRLKRRNNPLRKPDGQTTIEDAALDPFLQGVSESQFNTLFGINHEELIQGGKSILEGKNDLGELLFAAGTGLTTASQALRAIQEDHDKLFKSGGRLPPLNSAITEYNTARTTAVKAMLPSADWEKHDELLRKAREEKARLEARLAEARREQLRLERIQQAAPLLAERRLKTAQLDALGALPSLPDDFRERWRQAGNDLELAKRTLADAETEAEGYAEGRKAMSVPHDLLALADSIDPLRNELAKYQADRRNRPTRVSERDRAADDAAKGLRDLGLDPNNPPRLTRAQREAIQKLAQSLPIARKERDRLAGEVEGASRQRRQLLAERAALPELGHPEALALALERARGAGDLDATLATLHAAIDQATKQITKDAARLKFGKEIPVERLETMPLPGIAEIEIAHDDLRNLDSKLENLRTKWDEARQRVDEAAAAIQRLRLSGDVPTEADLIALREHRDTLWAQLRRHWLDGEPLDSAAERVSEYERAVQQADEIADRLRREADRVAQLVQLESQHGQAQAQAAALASQVAEAQSRHDAAQESWNALWAPTGIVPDTPRAMRDWLTKQVEPLRAKLAEREKHHADHATATQQRTDIRHDLNAILTALGAPTLEAESSHASTIDNAQATLNRLRQVTQKREEIDRDLRKLDNDLESNRLQQETAKDTLIQLEAEWVQAVAAMGLGASATPEQALGALETLTDAVKHQDDARKFDREIAEIDRATSGFVDRVKAIAARVAPPITEPGPEAVAQALLARLDDARKLEKTAQTLDQNLSKAEEKARVARESVAQYEVTRTAMVREAGCQNPEDVPTTLDALEEARPLRETLDGIERGLLQSGRGATIDQIATEVESIPSDALEALLDRAKSETNALDESLAELQSTIGAEQNELARMDGGDAAAEAASQASALAAKIASQADQYIRLRLAGALLREGIERHRQRNQGPILGRAGGYFARLTLGSFEGLQVGEGSKGEPILLGIRPGGENVKVEGLSDGSADALYLALRLAGLEVYLDAHPPMPLIVDDILIQFDDDRAMAALQALAALSRRTQILLFTHHRRLVDLAESLDTSTRYIHELPVSAK